MNLDTFLSRCVGYYRTGYSYTLRSAPGRGKTTTIERAPAIIGAALGLEMGYSYISAPAVTPADMIGYLIPGTDAGGHRISEFTRPFWWYTRDGRPLEDYKGGIIFVDEEDKGDADIKKIIGEMGESGRAGPHRLPPGWVVWMAGNRREDRSGSTRELDHLINRRCEINIKDDVESWKTWAIQNGLPPIALAFAEANPQIVFGSKAPDVQGPWTTPRSFVKAIKHLTVFTPVDGDRAGMLPTDDAAQEDAKGFMGAGGSQQLMAFARIEQDLPKLGDILASPMTADIPSRPDAQMLVAFSLAARADTGNMPALVAYMDRYPQEFSVLFADAACRRDVSLVSLPCMDDWCLKNASLMNTLTKLRKK